MSKIAVVTGGAGAIGQAVADRLAKENRTIVLLDLNEEAGKEVVAGFLKRGIDLTFLRADPRSRSDSRFR